jgi:prepilin-type N-terminal cleavage/methylation domain-containing protein
MNRPGTTVGDGRESEENSPCPARSSRRQEALTSFGRDRVSLLTSAATRFSERKKYQPRRSVHSISTMAGTESLPPVRRATAFTLIELLIVIVIIGILASIGLPAMKGIGQANLTASANRQILDDLGLARLKAINERTTVYVVFVPPSIFQKIDLERSNPQDLRSLSNLISGQFTAYALISARTVGDQPGQATPRYLTDWKALPEGMLIPPYKYDPRLRAQSNPYNRAFDTNNFPFPRATSSPFPLPYIAFNSQGQLVSQLGQQDELIPLVKGSIFFPRDNKGNFVKGDADVQLTPPGTTTNNFQYVRINWLTGRPKVELPEFK